MERYTDYKTVAKKERQVIDVLISKYKKIKDLESDIKAIKADNSFNMGKVEKYIVDNKIDGIRGNDFLMYLRDYTSSPSFKRTIEIATSDIIINKTVASKLYGLYETMKQTRKRLTVKL